MIEIPFLFLEFVFTSIWLAIRVGVWYKQKYGGLTPEMMLSHSFFYMHPDVFYDFYREHMIHPQAKPNAAHRKLAELEKAGKLSALITQNIDGLHKQAGNRFVYELHGSVHENHCLDCGRFFPLDFILNTQGVPKCPDCGGRMVKKRGRKGEVWHVCVTEQCRRRVEAEAGGEGEGNE